MELFHKKSKKSLRSTVNCESLIVHSKRSAFTVIELIVSFTMFAVVLSLVTSVFITSMRSQRGIISLVAANDNTYLMLEQMAREIRVGTGFNFTGDDQFEFKNRRGDIISYRFIEESPGIPGRIERSDSSVLGGEFKQISASNVNVKDLFITNNCGSVAPLRMTLHMKIGAAGPSEIEGIFNDIQTTIANRNLAKCS